MLDVELRVHFFAEYIVYFYNGRRLLCSRPNDKNRKGYNSFPIAIGIITHSSCLHIFAYFVLLYNLMPHQKDNFIFGLHPVIEAIESGKEIEKIFIQANLTSQVAKDLQRLLRENDIQFQYVPLEKLNRITGKNHQGVVAYVSEITYQKTEDILPFLFEQGKVPLLLILDEITDVRNMGALVRTAECAGAQAVIIPQKGSALINAEGMKASAGALNILPVCREKSLGETVRFLQNSGVQVLACNEKTDTSYTAADLTGPTAFVLGSEGKGISNELLDLCDKQVKIPLMGKIDSLNVSVSAGIVLFEAVRQRTINTGTK